MLNLFLLAALSLVVAAQPAFVVKRWAVLAGGAVTCIACLLAGVLVWRIHRALNRSYVEYTAVPVGDDGRKTLALRSLPAIPGARVLLVGSGIEHATRATVDACQFRIRYQGAESEGGKSCYSFDGPACLLDRWVDRDVPPAGAPIEIDYTVSPLTRPLLDDVRVAVTYPFRYRLDLSYAPLVYLVAAVPGAVAVVGAFALVVAGLRRRRSLASR